MELEIVVRTRDRKSGKKGVARIPLDDADVRMLPVYCAPADHFGEYGTAWKPLPKDTPIPMFGAFGGSDPCWALYTLGRYTTLDSRLHVVENEAVLSVDGKEYGREYVSGHYAEFRAAFETAHAERLLVEIDG